MAYCYAAVPAAELAARVSTVEAALTKSRAFTTTNLLACDLFIGGYLGGDCRRSEVKRMLALLDGPDKRSSTWRPQIAVACRALRARHQARRDG